MTIYKQNNTEVTRNDYDRQKKLVNLYNQVHGTSYTKESVGLDKKRINRPANNGMTANTNNLLFGHYRRTGMAYSTTRKGVK